MSACLRDALDRRILVLDGAMGTMLQVAGLGAADFGGAPLEGCNENLTLTRPDVIRRVHVAYREAGADAISTNTFGCAPWVLGEYGLAERAYEITRAAARLAREAAGDALVLGALGPSTRSISVTRNITFDEVCEGYALQAAALIDGGVDAILLETAQDTLNVKAAGRGIRRHAGGRCQPPADAQRHHRAHGHDAGGSGGRGLRGLRRAPGPSDHRAQLRH